QYYSKKQYCNRESAPLGQYSSKKQYCNRESAPLDQYYSKSINLNERAPLSVNISLKSNNLIERGFLSPAKNSPTKKRTHQGCALIHYSKCIFIFSCTFSSIFSTRSSFNLRLGLG